MQLADVCLTDSFLSADLTFPWPLIQRENLNPFKIPSPYSLPWDCMTVSYLPHPYPLLLELHDRQLPPPSTPLLHDYDQPGLVMRGAGSSVPIYTTPLLRYRAWNMTACCLRAYWLGGGQELLHSLDTLLLGLLKGLSHEIDFKIFNGNGNGELRDFLYIFPAQMGLGL
jgi:hypothetical protein